MDVLMGPLLTGVLFGIGYWAMEPFVRRRWPQMLVSWTRLLRGQWNNPTVARDFLLGGVCFFAIGLTSTASR